MLVNFTNDHRSNGRFMYWLDDCVRKMSTFAERLNQRMNALKLRQKDLAQISGVKTPLLSAFMSGTRKPGADNLLDLSAALQCNPHWLLRGKGPIPNDPQESTPPPYHLVPVLQAKDVESWLAGTAEFTESLPCPVFSGPKTFAIKVSGSAMSPRFGDGDIIFVDPRIKDLRNGAFVVYFPQGDKQQPQFKKLELVDTTMFYNSLNQDLPGDMRYLSVNEDDILIGHVVAHLKQI